MLFVSKSIIIALGEFEFVVGAHTPFPATPSLLPQGLGLQVFSPAKPDSAIPVGVFWALVLPRM